ncbi:oligosaccharide flippase family protein [Flavihumibacter rivuli]|uniref:oligosaccharide flippase family protein n=1 Tax=Flavihumibacter rivuli TaxID=2838156 RepID=UPI001BDE4FF8|nr:oligosaccharide flippase family protein [Flavihumibacter rivuli]ULQ57546.1 oligosaccharide flippase family protein [Flavihumibacter rivuli]
MPEENPIPTTTALPLRYLVLQYANTAFNIIFPLILFPYTTRVLGPAGYGVIGFYESMLLVVSVWAAFGVNFFGLRLLSKSAIGDTAQANRVLHLLLINLLMAMAGVVVYLLYVLNKAIPIGSRQITFLYAYIMLIYMVHLDWYFQSQERFRFLMLRTFFLRVFILVGSLLFVKKADDLIIYILISTFNYSLIALSSIWNIRDLFPHWKWDPALFRDLIRSMFPFAAIGVLSALYFSWDTILLARIGKVADLGHYTVAAKIVRLSMNVFVGASIVFFVRLFRTEVDRNLQEQSVKMTIHFSLPIAALIFCFAQPIIFFVSGKAYLPSVVLLRIFALLWVVVPLHDFFTIQVLLVHHREKLLALLYLSASIISLLLNLLLIPLYFTTGAAVSVVIVEFMVLVAGIYFSRRYFHFGTALLREFVFAASSFPVALLAAQVAFIITDMPFLQLVSGVLVFGAGYALLQLVIFRNGFWTGLLVLVRDKLSGKRSMELDQ